MARREAAGTPALIALRRAGVVHSVHSYDHDPAAPSFGLEAATALGLDPGCVFKTLLAEADGHPVVAIVPVDRMLDLKALASARGAKRARMMDAVAAERLSGYVVGGISPLAQRAASPSVLDATAREWPMVYVSAGRRGLDVGLAPDDLVRLVSAQVAPIAADR